MAPVPRASMCVCVCVCVSVCSLICMYVRACQEADEQEGQAVSLVRQYDSRV